MVLISEMSPGVQRRAQSEVAIDRARSNMEWRRLRGVQRSASENRVRRFYSIPDLTVIAPRTYSADPTALWLDYRYRPRSSRYGGVYDLHDNWWYSNYYDRPLTRYSSYTGYPYYDSDSYRYRNPGAWSRADNWDPSWWRRYRDPYYTRPLYSGYRPYYWENYDADRATSMYRSGLISYDALDKYWLSPYTSYRRSDDWRSYGVGPTVYSSSYYPYSYYSRPSYSYLSYW